MFTIVQFTLCRDTQKQSERFKMFDSLLVCSLAYVKMMICEIIKKKKIEKEWKANTHTIHRTRKTTYTHHFD